MFTRILYATDGSEHARKALAYVREMALVFESDVLVVNVFQSVSEVFGLSNHKRTLTRRVGSGHKILEETCADLEASGVRVEQELLEGPMAGAILNVAQVRECDLIILGARGVSDLQGLLLGSVSHKVIQLADCPVLVVR